MLPAISWYDKLWTVNKLAFFCSDDIVKLSFQAGCLHKCSSAGCHGCLLSVQTLQPAAARSERCLHDYSWFSEPKKATVAVIEQLQVTCYILSIWTFKHSSEPLSPNKHRIVVIPASAVCMNAVDADKT